MSHSSVSRRLILTHKKKLVAALVKLLQLLLRVPVPTKLLSNSLRRPIMDLLHAAQQKQQQLQQQQRGPQHNQQQQHNNSTTSTGGALQEEEESPIAAFYAHKSLLITGATGFIGKVLIEKLLHSCPQLEKLYLLIRSADGKSAQERLDEIIEQRPLSMRLSRELVRRKLVAIPSDLALEGLGLSEQHARLLSEQVSLVFHVAASVKFEAPLEMNLRHNVLATQQLLKFAVHFRKLQCFVHVSTAYSNCQLHLIEERVYPLPVPEDPMLLAQQHQCATQKMLDNRPNTYTLTKALAENVCCQYADRINLVIVRPSIVMSALSEPSEGWVDTINGPVGLSVLGALGILQKIKVNSEVVFDLIPVDMVTNAMVSIGWAAVERRAHFNPSSTRLPSCVLASGADSTTQLVSTTNSTATATATTTTSCYNKKDTNNNHHQHSVTSSSAPQADGQLRVFNLTTGTENPCSFYQYFSTGRDEAYLKPSRRALRPLLTIPKQKGMSRCQYWIHKVFSHLLFAYIVDTLLSLCGQKRMVVKAVKRMHHANEVFDYFCSNQWHFVNDNVKRLRQLQTKHDKLTFNCDVRLIKWEEYARIGWLGCRRFILKEDDSTFAQAARRYKLICFIYYIVKLILLGALTSLAGSLISSHLFALATLLPLYGVVYLL